MPKKKDKLSTHKKKAWDSFSLYIRTRDSLKTTGGVDYCLCVSCGDKRPRTGMYCIQAGHFIAGRNNAVLFSEEGVHGQCQMCNHGVKGRRKPLAHVTYYEFMEKEYGKETIERLKFESGQTVIIKAWEYDAIAQKYEELTQALLAPLNNVEHDGVAGLKVK